MRTRLLIAFLLLFAPGAKAQVPSAAEQVKQMLAEVTRLRGALREQTAREVAEKALALAERLLPGDPAHAEALRAAAELAERASDHLAAGQRYQALLALEEKRLGAKDFRVAQLYDRIAFQHWMRGEYARAEPHFQRALAIFEQVQGPDSDYFAMQLGIQAAYRTVRHDYARAEELHARALAILEKRHGPMGIELANPLVQLGFLHSWRGDFARASQQFERVLAIFQKHQGPNDEGVPGFLEVLANLHHTAGKEDLARSYYDKSEPIRRDRLAAAEKRFGPNAWEISTPLNGLAALYQARGDVEKALPLLERLLALYENKFGKDHLAVRNPLFHLAKAREKQRRYDEAAKLYERALAIEEKSQLLGPIKTGAMLLAHLRRLQGAFKAAADLNRANLAGFERSYGPKSRPVGTTLNVLAHLAWAQGDLSGALPLFTRSEEILESHLAIALSTGTEKDRRNQIANVEYTLDGVLSFHFVAAPQSAEAAELAITTVLRRKGRALDAASSASAVRNRLDPTAHALFDELASKRAQLAKLALQGPGSERPDVHLRRVAELEEQVRRLEIQLSTASAVFRAQSRAITLAAVRARIPKDAVLVELISFHRVDPKVVTEGPAPASSRRYGAYIVATQGPIRFADLGEAEPIDRAVARLRKRISSPQLLDVRRLARGLDDKVFRPVRALIGEATHLLLSPDGALNLVPFGALVDEQDRYALSRYTFTYLTSGRDLLRLAIRMTPRQPPVILADPDFSKGKSPADGGAPAAGPRTRGRRSFSLGDKRWDPLPGSAEEARKLKDLFSDALVYTGAEATEAVLKALTGPRLLHVATHGFFLPDQEHDPTRAVENPLLRSGLVLSGANERESGEEDGVLTALEAASLDLWGTRLVVLSACETGVGEVQVGEGVQGLRRALVVAGSESQLLSLWRVDDEATRDLMVGYYRRLQSGAGRSEALREAQQALLADPKRAHPFFWAAFIPSGDWSPL
jgi:CHAT domain-containing protein